MQITFNGTHGDYNDSDYFTNNRECKVQTLGEAVEHFESFLRAMGFTFGHLEVHDSEK